MKQTRILLISFRCRRELLERTYPPKSPQSQQKKTKNKTGDKSQGPIFLHTCAYEMNRLSSVIRF